MAEPARDVGVEEDEPLLRSTHNDSTESEISTTRQRDQQNSSVDGTGGSVWYKCPLKVHFPRSGHKYLWRFFYTLCFITGQYINFEILKILCSPKFSRKTVEKFVSVAAMIPFVIQVIVCVGYVATALFVDGLTVANASLPKTIAFHHHRNDCILPEEHWKFTTAVSTSSVAAIFSYGLMTVFILFLANFIQCCCASREHRSEEEASTGRHQTASSNASNAFSECTEMRQMRQMLH